MAVKDVKSIIAEHGEALSEEAREAIVADILANYRTIAETTKKAERIAQLEEQNAALAEQVSKVDGDSEELEKLRQQVEAYAKAEDDRKAKEAAQAQRDEFRAKFDGAVGAKEFANSIIADSVFDRVYQLCSDDASLGVEAAINSVTKDAYGVWKNPQHDPAKMPTGQIITGKPSEDEAKRSFLRELISK